MAGFVARSPTMQPLFDAVDLLHSADNTAALIAGESGTGKELIARAIHFGGSRAGGPFVPVNCAAIPANLAESQFFVYRELDHEKPPRKRTSSIDVYSLAA